jgi:hypothetical protein
VNALERLIDSFLVSQAEKEDLVSRLSFSPEVQWLKEYYLHKIDTCRGTNNQTVQDNLSEEKRKVMRQLQIGEIDMQKQSPLKSKEQSTTIFLVAMETAQPQQSLGPESVY